MPILDTTKDLAALFSQQVISTPDGLALEDEHQSYTYSELDRKVDSLAERLRHYGVVRDSLVGILLPRSADYVIACLAALRAGGAFLVLELAYPPELLGDVLEDAAPVVVVTHNSEVGKIREGTVTIILDEGPQDSNGTNGTTELPPLPSEDDLERLAFVA